MPSHSEAVEKRLRSVYDAFDQRNYKGAIKQCNAGIQKHPECFTFKSLKAVALDRSGKQDEALQLADEVLAAAPADDHVLNMLLLVLKPAGRARDVTPAYEAACSKQPNNEELLQGLFACHVRSFSYTAQQQVAMKLNKSHPNELYQWWVIASLALQAHAAAVQARLATGADTTTANSSSSSSGGGGGGGSEQGPAAGSAGLAADKLLALAEAMAGRLLSKAPAQGGHHSWESVMMYLGLLQAQGKHDAALAVVRGPLGSTAISLPAERREAEAALLLAKGDLQAAAGLYQQALQEQPDDWAVLLLYLDCLLPATARTLPACGSTAVAQMVTGVEASTRPGCQTGGLAALLAAMNIGGNSSEQLQDRVSQAEAFITSLATSAGSSSTASNADSSTTSSKSSGVLRGPELAFVELAKRTVQLGMADEQQLVDAVLRYHDRFGHLVSCAMDVFCYLELLSSRSRQQLSMQLDSRAQQAAEEFQQQQEHQQQPDSKALLKLLRRQMSARQIQADMGAPSFTDPAAAAAHAQQLLHLYAAALPLYAGLDERERGPADELLWLAAAALVTAATLQQQQPSDSSSSIKYLLQAVLVLEAAAKGRPYCAPVRLGLTALYGLLGNAAGAVQHFSVLDVKHVQHDTLSSHHLLPLLVGLKADKQAAALLKPTCALFEDHMVDAADTLMQAYRNGTHTKVLEFVCFKERLERSHTFVLARAERAILSISTAAAAPGDVSAALSTAVQALPLEELDSMNWMGMHFNEDLTTRLPWMPPIQGPRQLVVLMWWEQQQKQQLLQDSSSGSSSGSSAAAAACWWRQVAAAEADVPAAAALRQSMKAAAQQRWLLPHLLHAALAVGSSNSSSKHDPEQLSQLLSQYAAALGFSSTAELCQELAAALVQGQQQAASSSSGLPLSRLLQLLDAALFTLAASVQDTLHAGTAAEAGSPNGCSAFVSEQPALYAARLSAGLQQLQGCLVDLLQPTAAYQGCVLPGYVLSAAALALSESCSWIVLCLESWTKLLKQGKKKKPSKTQTGSDPAAAAAAADHPSHGVVVEALLQVQHSVQALVKELHGAAQHMLEGTAEPASAALLAEFNHSSNAAIKALVGWEPQLSAQLVLSDLVTQQRLLLTQLKDGSSKLSRRVEALACN